MPGYDPNNYVTVAERLTMAHDLIQTIITEPPVMLTDAMGYIRCTVGLSDGRSSTGTASFRLDLTGGRAQATNPIEDCETSAIGRALGMLGFGSRTSIASREEVDEAQRRAGASFTAPREQTQATNGNGAKASEAQVKALFGIWRSAGYEGTLKDWITKTYQCSVNDLTKAQASEAIETLKPAEK